MGASVLSLAAAAAGAAAAQAWGWVAGFLVTMATYKVGVRLGMVKPQDFDTKGQGFLSNFTSSLAPIPVVYGFRRVGGVRVFTESAGDNNEHLYTLIALCEGEVNDIPTVYFDGVDSTDSRFTSFFTLEKHFGSDDQLASNLLLDNLPNSWTSDHRLRGVAYLVIRFFYDANDAATPWVGIPQITADVEGRKVYDPRDAGQLQHDPSTWLYSNNPSLCILDYLTNQRFGKGLEISDIDTDSVEASANFCDVTFATPDSPSTNLARYTCDGVVDTSKSLMDNVTALLSSCRGKLIWSQGLYILSIEGNETIPSPPDFEFTEDNIIGDWKVSLGQKKDLYNRVRASFYNSDRNFQSDIVFADSETSRLSDNGELLDIKVELPFTTNQYRALNIASIERNLSRESLSCEFKAAFESIEARVGDVVPVTHSVPGWTQKLFKIMKMDLDMTGEFNVIAREYEAAAYTPDTLTVQETSPDTNLPDPTVVAAPTALVLQSGTDHLLIGTDGSIVSRVLASWTAAADNFVLEYEIQLKKSSDVAWIPYGRPRDVSIYLAPLEDGVSYDIRVRSISVNGYVSNWLQTNSYVVVGKTEAPADVDTFRVDRQPDGTREFTFSMVSPPADLAGFELRYDLGINSPLTAWADMTPLNDGLLVSSPWETNQLAAGVFTMAIKAKDTTGNESANATYLTTTLGDPRIGNALIQDNLHDTGWPGTKTSCWVDNNNDLIPDASIDWTGLPATWSTWTTWNNSPVASMVYEHDAYDLGAVASFEPLVSLATEDGSGTVLVEERHKDNISDAYSAYATVGGTVTARFIQIRITVTNPPAGGLVTGQIILSAEVIEEFINDLPTSSVSSPAGDFRVPIQKSFSLITSVQVALQNVGAQYSWELIDKSVSLGPRIKIWDNSTSPPSLVDATIDVRVTGLPT